MKRLIAILGILFLSFFYFGNSVAFAYEHPDPFIIKEIVVSNATNFYFRVVSSTPDAWLCHNGPTNDAWGYINESDSGAKGKIAALMLAYTLGKRVRLTTLGVDTDIGRMCNIIEVAVID